MQILLANGADVHVRDEEALWWATLSGHAETVQVLVKHIFAPESWREKSRAAIEGYANALYDKIKATDPSIPLKPEHLQQVGSILLDCALTCWEQVRPAPPKLTIKPAPGAAEASVKEAMIDAKPQILSPVEGEYFVIALRF